MASKQTGGKLLTPDTPPKRTGSRTSSKSRSAVRGSASQTPSTVPPGGKKAPAKQNKNKKNTKNSKKVEIQPLEPAEIVVNISNNDEEEKEIVIQVEEHKVDIEKQIEIVSMYCKLISLCDIFKSPKI